MLKKGAALAIALFFWAGSAFSQTYYLYVAAESQDEVSLVAFDARTGKGSVEKVIGVGEFPTEIEGPHGIAIDPSGDYWYLTMGHGVPFGHVYKYRTGSDVMVDRAELGMFPATLDISPATGWLFVSNFNLHGDHEPSTISVVDSESMEEISRINTGIMPHGSRMSIDGSRQYHVSMMTDELIEVDAFRLGINRRMRLYDDPSLQLQQEGMSHNMSSMTPAEMAQNVTVSPTWATPHPIEPFVYVAGNVADIIYEINTRTWRVQRMWNTPGRGPYNLELTNNGRLLVVTYKQGGQTGIWNVEQGEEVARITNSRRVTHGVVISPDDRFAFISVEGIGGEPGSVDVISLETMERVDVIETGKQAAGIAFWKKVD